MMETRDTHGSVKVFQQIWERMLQEGEEPEFNAQEQAFAKQKFDALLNILPPAPGSVLECGSGSGEVSAFLAEQGYQVTLLDDAPAALDVARTRFDRVDLSAEFVVGNVYALPFEDNSFDILTSFGLLEHFEDVEKVIAEMVRVLRPGGFFFADIVTERFSIQTLGHAFNGAVRIGYYGLRGNPRKGIQEAKKLFRPDFYENSYSIEQYRQFMRNAGLSDIIIRGNRPFPLLTLPGPAERLYAGIMRKSGKLWRWFDNAGNPITNTLGAGWWAWGTKH